MNPPFSRVDPPALELSHWESVRSSQSIAVIQTYLDRYPNGLFADVARARIREIEDKARHQQQSSRERETLPAPSSNSALVPRTWQKPSVDCTRPGEPLEFLICADGEIAEWDGRLGRAFRRKLNQAADKQQVRQDERNWIERRSAECKVPRRGDYTTAQLAPLKPCILQMTRERVFVLEAN